MTLISNMQRNYTTVHHKIDKKCNSPKISYHYFSKSKPFCKQTTMTPVLEPYFIFSTFRLDNTMLIVDNNIPTMTSMG